MKKPVYIFYSVVMMSLAFNNVYALNCSQNLTGNAAPSISQIVCPFARIFNAMILVAGIIFTIILVYSAIKLASAMGDPKGFEGAKLSFVHALLGFGVVVGFFAILLVIFNLLGINLFQSGPAGIFDALQQQIIQMLGGSGSSNGQPIVINP